MRQYFQWVQQPLPGFALVAAALFALDYFKGGGKTLLQVSKETQVSVIQQATERKGETLSASEQKQAIDHYIRDQILIDEAFRLGLQHDPFFRRKILSNYRALLRKQVAPPSPTTLRSYFAAHPAEFAEADRWTLDYLYFPPAAKLPPDAAKQADSREFVASHAGVSEHYPDYTQSQVKATMGYTISATLKSLPIGQWQGPFPSQQGTGLVRIRQFSAGSAKPFEQVVERVKDAWLDAQLEQTLDERSTALRADYVIRKE